MNRSQPRKSVADAFILEITEHQGRDMLPYWIELDAADLIQGTAVLSMAAAFFLFSLFSPTSRA